MHEPEVNTEATDGGMFGPNEDLTGESLQDDLGSDAGATTDGIGAILIQVLFVGADGRVGKNRAEGASDGGGTTDMGERAVGVHTESVSWLDELTAGTECSDRKVPGGLGKGIFGTQLDLGGLAEAADCTGITDRKRLFTTLVRPTHTALRSAATREATTATNSAAEAAAPTVGHVEFVVCGCVGEGFAGRGGERAFRETSMMLYQGHENS